MANPFVTFCINIQLSSKGNSVSNFFCSLINGGTVHPVKWTPIYIRFYKILVHFRTQIFQHITQSSQNGIIAHHGVPGLRNVIVSKMVKMSTIPKTTYQLELK